jgi:hypothetical protein
MMKSKSRHRRYHEHNENKLQGEIPAYISDEELLAFIKLIKMIKDIEARNMLWREFLNRKPRADAFITIAQNTVGTFLEKIAWEQYSKYEWRSPGFGEIDSKLIAIVVKGGCLAEKAQQEIDKRKSSLFCNRIIKDRTQSPEMARLEKAEQEKIKKKEKEKELEERNLESGQNGIKSFDTYKGIDELTDEIKDWAKYYEKDIVSISTTVRPETFFGGSEKYFAIVTYRNKK